MQITKPHNRTPGTSDLCTYLGCHAPGVGELRAHYYKDQNNSIPWTMCKTHIQKDAHPEALHDKLVKW